MRTIATVSAFLLLAGVAQANLFQNGDFEVGDWSKWSVKPTGNGSTAIQDVVYYDIDGPGPLGESRAGRLNVGQQNFTPGVWEGMLASQAVNLVGSQEYAIGMDVSAWNNQSATNAQGGRFELMIGNKVLDTWDAGRIEAGQKLYGRIEAKYTPGTSGQYEVGVRITRPYLSPSAVYQLVDNAELIPEPASLLLLGLGLLLRRR